MKLRTTLLVVFLFSGVVFAYFYLSTSDKSPAPSSDSVHVGTMQLMALDPGDEVDWLQIQNKKKKLSMTFEKEIKGDEWMIRYPVIDTAETSLLEGLVSALKISTKARRLKGVKNWEEFGLSDPEIKIGVETKNKKKRRSLALGDPAPIGNFIFARWEDEDEYFLLNADFKKAFDQTLYSLRQKRVLRMPLKALTRIAIQVGGTQYELSKMEDEWYWVEPLSLLGEKIEKRDMDTFYGGLQQLFIKDFLDGTKKDKKDLGFSSKSPTLKVIGAPSVEETIYVGKELPARDALFALRKGEEHYFLIAKSNLDQFLGEVQTISKTYLKSPQSGVPAAS